VTLIEQTFASSPEAEPERLSREDLLAKIRNAWNEVQDVCRQDIAGNLAKLRQNFRMSQRALAEETGMPQTTIGRLLKWADEDFPPRGPFAKVPATPRERVSVPDAGTRPDARTPLQAVNSRNVELRLEIERRDALIAERNSAHARELEQRDAHIAEIEAALELREPEPVALISPPAPLSPLKRSISKARTLTKQRARFENTLFVIREACLNNDELVVPEITAQERGEAMEVLVNCIESLRDLMSRIKEDQGPSIDEHHDDDDGGESDDGDGSDDAGENKDEVERSADDMREKFKQLDADADDDLTIPDFMQRKPKLEE
jgi:hypothetical protein